MKKMISFFLLTLFLLSSLTTGTATTPQSNISTHSISISLSQPRIQHHENDFISITMDEASSYLHLEGKPMIPVFTKTIAYPIGTIIENISVNISSKALQLNQKIMPAPRAIPKHPSLAEHTIQTKTILDETVYQNKGIYPKQTYSIEKRIGLEHGKRVLYITINTYAQYEPTKDRLIVPNNITINIITHPPKTNQFSNDLYDLFIITDDRFTKDLEDLVSHKNSIGIRTIVESVQDIYPRYQGRDKQEDIKLRIMDAIEQWGIDYVLIAGGQQRQTGEWFVPIRTSNLHDRSFWNDSYVTDLYYADIYRYNETTASVEFEDWDSNNNNIFGEWTWIYDTERGWWYDLDKKDDLDLYPDVAIGRIACRNRGELKNVIEKIIIYENTAYNQDWFKSIILCGGDTFPYNDGGYEGEIETGFASEQLEPLGFESRKLWTSTGSLTRANDVIKEMRKGSGFLFLSGHGTPREWCTHPVKDNRWIDLYQFQMRNIGNTHKLPITVVGGCHNSQIDVGLHRMTTGVRDHGLSYFLWQQGIDCFSKWTWVSSSWSWNLLSQRNDGSIAVIGNTGLGWGVSGSHCIDYNEGYLTSHFFQHYATLSQQGIHNLGIIHAESLTDYINRFSTHQNPIDRKTVEQWILLGDPSLHIGGINPETLP